MRFRVQGTLFSESLFRSVEQRLKQFKEIQSAQVRRGTGSIIIVYNPNNTRPRKVTELLIRAFKEGALPHSASSQSQSHPSCFHEKRLSQSLLYPCINAIALSGYLAYLLIRRLLFRLPVSSRPLSMTAAVATIGAIPLLHRAWQDIRERKEGKLFPFLTAACALAIVIGEALTALEIVWVLAVGTLLEEYAAERARRAIQDILQIIPERTTLMIEGQATEVLVSEVRVGDCVVVEEGDKIPVDGMVMAGEALVDEAHITGRSQPEFHRARNRVYAGTRVQEGSLQIRAEKLGEETYLYHITQLVENALSQRAPVEKRADVLAVRLTRLGLIATGGTLLLTGSLARALSVLLVMACPCATVLAASTAVTAAIANAARRQILIKGGVYLEQVDQVDCFCFDKTGTITTDQPEVIDVIPLTMKFKPEAILSMAAAAEGKSSHPLARALVKEAKSRGIKLVRSARSEVLIGRGVRARIGQHQVHVGNQPFMAVEGIDITSMAERLQGLVESGYTIVYVARNRRLLGMIALANALRTNVGAVLLWLQGGEGYRTCLMSGDSEEVVGSLSKKLSFDEYRGDLLPDEKARMIDEMKKNGYKVLMVGDGVNDALALSKADVGVSMGGGGSEVAIEASDIALIEDDLKGLVIIRQLSRKTLGTIEQNFFLATSTNILGVILGVTGWLTPMMGGVLHIVHTLGIIYNSHRLLQWEPPSVLKK
jgi:cation-transporting P-type ATPase C